MEISQVKLKGFRNFKDETINFANKTLIIGANDIGKSNLLHALRIILDRKLFEYDIEPQDYDFYAYEETNDLSILIKFKAVTEDCVKSKLKENVSDTDELYLSYSAHRDPITRSKSYKFSAGPSEDKLDGIESRSYLKVLNLKYISSNRDISSYIRKEKQNLLQGAKKKRDADDQKKDDEALVDIEKNLIKINEDVTNLSFIKNATESINKELNELSLHHAGHQTVFDVGASDTSNFINNIQLASKVNGKTLILGGEGRNNQIFLALWAARNQIQEEQLFEVTIYSIEEPEAHLHPHQQRKLAEYLSKILKGQVVITTHSPQITSEFSPNSIIRLYNEKYETKAANNGCAKIIEDAFIQFGYRLNIIPSEAFFADVVLLVEGPSEELLYKALAKEIKELGIDLDKLNISILMVDGVGFDTYIKILSELKIPWVMRTDNDLTKIPKKDEYRFAGIERGLQIFKAYFKDEQLGKLIDEKSSSLSGFKDTPSKEAIDIAKEFEEELKKYNIFFSKKDLENDLLSSEISDEIKKFLQVSDIQEAINLMQKRKATTMYNFLSNTVECLSKLKDNDITLPLKACKKIVEANLYG